jgi:hypothetical protein
MYQFLKLRQRLVVASEYAHHDEIQLGRWPTIPGIGR